MSSPIAFDDTQFDLDLSDHLDQFPDGPGPTPVAQSPDGGDPVDAAAGPLVGVVPVGDPWGVPVQAAADVSAADVSGIDRISDTPTSAMDEPVAMEGPVGDVEPGPMAAATAAPAFAATTIEDVPASGCDPESVDAAAAAPLLASPAFEDVPVPWVPAEGGTATYTTAVARAVDPPTSVHSVFAVTPPQGTPVVAPPPAPVASARAPRAARRRRRGIAVLAAVLAFGLVAGGAGLAVATNDGGGDGDVAEVSSPGEAVALPPAGAEADKPEDDVAAPAAGDDAAPDVAVVPPVADPDPEGVAQATEAVQTFLAVRGTDAERAVSSQGGRDELDAAIASIGRAVPQGDPLCSPGADPATFTCVLATDQGPITFTVGPDADDPQTSGFEVIGATA